MAKFAVLVLAATFLVVVNAGHDHKHHEGWGWSPPHYKYSYGVADSHTWDKKQAAEWRHGDNVAGWYSLLEPGGSYRVVTYVADKGGFKAKVHRGWGHH